MKDNSDKPDYTGKRALLLTRVSTPKQIEMYGHAWQEMQIRKLLIEPLGLQLDEKHHIIRDTYTGLEFRHREALTRILEMAERGEIDVVCMEVLDRGLGRKGLPREMFRMQLRELGVRILTTDPNRKDLSEMSQEGKLDKGTREYLSGQLQILAKQEEEAKEQQAKEQAFQKQYNELHERIAEFHERCQEWREKLDDPEFIPSFEFKRDACEFFGITAIVYRRGRDERFEIQTRPPSIMSLISSA